MDEGMPLTKPDLAALEIVRRLGDEHFCDGERKLGFDLLDFWRWCSSDLANNVMRGIVAEYLVAQALGVADGTRVEWDNYDLRTKHAVTVEVKSSAYLQSWDQKDYSNIVFNVPPTHPWDNEIKTRSKEPKRQADVYVFALLHHKGHKRELNPMDLKQWAFYVVSTATLDREIGLTQGSLTLSRLRKISPQPVNFDDLGQAIDGAFARQLEGEEG